MATKLDVVNNCLGTLGEAPLNTLVELHEFKSSILRLLDESNARIQSTGWWFNTEAVTFVPNGIGEVTLPGDCLKYQSGVRNHSLVQGERKPWIVERGTRLYDTRTQSYTLTEASIVGELVREVPFEDIPRVVNEFIAADVVLRFQSSYDADTRKREELAQTHQLAKVAANSENIRQLQINLLNINPRLSRIKSVARVLRY